jgi:hypothetical protein
MSKISAVIEILEKYEKELEKIKLYTEESKLKLAEEAERKARALSEKIINEFIEENKILLKKEEEDARKKAEQIKKKGEKELEEIKQRMENKISEGIKIVLEILL